ncbi:hypothetical protein F2Q70_00015536 [Brassica cretica]|uniref:Uncharacterized protein n=1 Tax=Brassica cretica TaxID=69181 RepID=A0A8S9HZJ1_BRACR|nr:hypothetical protein F2Q70_00015536 [Brassica cretica]
MYITARRGHQEKRCAAPRRRGVLIIPGTPPYVLYGPRFPPHAPTVTPREDMQQMFKSMSQMFRKEVGLEKFEDSSDPMETGKWLELAKEALGYLAVSEAFEL